MRVRAREARLEGLARMCRHAALVGEVGSVHRIVLRVVLEDLRSDGHAVEHFAVEFGGPDLRVRDVLRVARM